MWRLHGLVQSHTAPEEWTQNSLLSRDLLSIHFPSLPSSAQISMLHHPKGLLGALLFSTQGRASVIQESFGELQWAGLGADRVVLGRGWAFSGNPLGYLIPRST